MTCSTCGVEPAVRDGRCLPCWYDSPDRPKPVRDRFAKLDQLHAAGIAPYAYSYDPTHRLGEALELFETFETEGGDGDGPDVRVAGRMLSFRDMGKSAFAHLGDRDARLQVYFKRDVLDETGSALVDLLDLGDWIGVQGPLFRTRTGEVTVRAERVEMLSKSLRPLPFGKEEVLDSGERVVHSGFRDTEMRYRQRYADLAVNPDVRETFALRSRLVTGLRRWLDERGYLEVETPVLQPLYGGALALPFTTHANTLDQMLYLRVADELYLKRLIVGNLERVYEIGKDFRNEGIDRTHNPEFTMLELYEAYADYETIMELAETIVSEVVESVCGRLEFEYDGRTVNFARPWARLAYSDALREHADVDLRTASRDELVERAKATGREDAKELNRVQLLDTLFGGLVEPEIVHPTIVYDHPIEMSPLAKPKRGEPGLAERFEVIVMGTEMINAFSELNDPLDQYGRFFEQARLREEGDLEAHGVDEDYIRALEYGLPPTGGLGLGVDRLVMMVSGRTSIRDVVLYPILRPEEGR